MTTTRVRLTVTIDVVVDETTDLAALLTDIRGRRGSLDVAGYSFVADVDIRRPVVLQS